MKEVVDFSNFRQMHQKNKKELQRMIKAKSPPKKPMSSLWQEKRQDSISGYDRGENRIRDTINHRNVAETALKTEKKRHKQELANFLNQQQMIEEKIKIKEMELRNAEKKFSQSRNRLTMPLTKRLKTLKLKTFN